MKKFALIIAVATLTTALHAVDATLEIIQQNTKLPHIVIEAKKGDELAKKLHKMLIADLKVSGHFQVYDGGEFEAETLNAIDYANKKVDLVLRVSVLKNSPFTARARLHDINANQDTAIDKNYNVKSGGSALYPFIAHTIAVDVNDYAKAPDISWMKRFVALSKYTSSGEASIVVADYTLSYQKVVVSGGLNIFPRWGDSAQESIYYTKYLDRPTIMRYDVAADKSEPVVSSEGIAIVSDVKKDGSELLLSLSPEGQSDLYLYNVASKNLTRVTKFGGIDVNGAFAQDETKIVFVSDRLGYANVFMSNLDGSATEQVVFHGRNNSAVSAHGNYLAYTSRETNNEFGANIFNIYLISLTSDYIRRLSMDGTNQMPRFSADGQSVMYLKHVGAQSALGVIRLNYNKSYLFPLKGIRIQSFDW